jgi:CO dehydrogenase/acetyl-CoA synthase alpha subunit
MFCFSCENLSSQLFLIINLIVYVVELELKELDISVRAGCGRMLTVNFRQPSHEFTFGVGIDLISKLTILTLMIYQVHTRM